MSSWVALTRRAKLVEGENVLILGATGTAGHLAVQIAKRLGARRVVAAGRNREALESLKELGANETIPLDQDHDELVSSFHKEWRGPGIHIVIDYLWGAPAEAVLEAMSLRGFRPAVSRVRFVQVGASAGDTISLAAATLRSSAIELLGSGFGSASMREIFTSLDDFFHAAASLPFQFHAKAAPLRDVETLWNAPQLGARLVFQP